VDACLTGLNRLNLRGLIAVPLFMASLAALARSARPEALLLARQVLEQDAADQAWAAQVGAALTQRDTARLLAKTEQAVAKDARLLRVRSRDGRAVYPVLQFSGRAQLPGVAAVVAALADALEPLSIASWLTAPHPDLGGTPIAALRAGTVDDVVRIARRLARTAG